MLFRALRHPNFKLFFFGQGLSMVGTWMQRVAMGWLVYRLSDSALLLGLVGFAGQIPSFLIAPFAGVLADRMDRRRLLVVTQALAMLQGLTMAALVMSGLIAIWHIVLLSIVLGLVNGFDMPLRQSFVSEMVEDPNDLGNAIALNSILVNGSRLIGPSVAGLIIALWGEGACFLANGLSYLAVIVSLQAMKLNVRDLSRFGPARSFAFEIRDGLSYVRGFPPLRDLLLLLCVFSLVGLPYIQLLPVFARDILQGGPDALGYLMGATGVGALGGAWMLARRQSVIGLGTVIGRSALLFSLVLMFFSWSTNFWFSLALMPFIGFGQMVQFAAGNTLLQTLTDEDKRGRVMSFYTMTFMGFFPLGSLGLGALAEHLGAGTAVFGGALVFACLGGVFLMRVPRLRELAMPVYLRKGITGQGLGPMGPG